MKSKLTTFYIVRHGQTDWNVKGITQGQTDIPLNETGKLEALTLSKELNDVSFDAVFSSDLTRAKQTAEIIMLEKQMAITTTAALRERGFGKLEGRKWVDYEHELREQIEQLEKLTEQEKYTFKIVEDMESEDEVISRTFTFLRELAVAYEGKTVLIVSHGYLILLLLMHLGYGTHTELPPSSIKNTAYVKFSSDGVDFFIDQVNGVTKVQ